MITSKQWKEFNEYRDSIYQEVMNSPEYARILESLHKLYQPIRKEVKVKRGWPWNRHEAVEIREYKPDPFAVSIGLKMISLEESLLFSKVPKRTIEACLDWLASKPSN